MYLHLPKYFTDIRGYSSSVSIRCSYSKKKPLIKGDCTDNPKWKNERLHENS